jgi:hypothetical protein
MTPKQVATSPIVEPNGEFGRPLAAGTWTSPDTLGLDEADRLWWPAVNEGPSHRVRAGGPLLPSFLAIGLAGSHVANAVLAFARRWGPIAFCRHLYPAGHGPMFWPGRRLPASEWTLEPCASQQDGVLAWSPVEGFRLWSLRARATLTVAGDLQRKRLPGTPPAAAGVGDWRRAVGGLPLPDTIDGAWQVLAACLNAWLELGGVKPTVDWRHSRGAILLGGHGVVGALAQQLMLAVAGQDALALCSACGREYVPERRPRPDRRNYCQDCRTSKVPERDAARAFRERRGRPVRSVLGMVPAVGLEPTTIGLKGHCSTD